MVIYIWLENDAKVPDLCREHGFRSAQFFQWRSKLGGTDALLLKGVKELEDEKKLFKKMYAEEKFKSDISVETLKKSSKPSRRKVIARQCVQNHRVSIRLACESFSESESVNRNRAKKNAENQLVADLLLRLTHAHKRWGYGMCFLYLRIEKSFLWNHKRVYRIYRELELNLRIKSRRTKFRTMFIRSDIGY